MPGRDDGQFAAEILVARRQCEFQHAQFSVRIDGADALDVEVARIEHQLRRLGILPVERQRRVALQLLLAEVDREVGIEMGDAHLVGLRVGMRIGGVCHQRQCECSQREDGKWMHAGVLR